ncbi:hypothetical protein FJD38_16515 [Pseudomonas saxonica]|uniref:Tox-PLDMTX domain-containing protein n=2 Tax=Pseudomonas saxonica TaxID=2600598 RepID=A0ABY3GG63_9PSED|nr:hypothetical protein [Pseudomonas saxonica]TWR88281.1 hypothetical protein FJD38_16515 [Pseudomonas saxonica]
MEKLALEKPVDSHAQPVTAPMADSARQNIQGGPEPLHLLTRNHTASSDLTAPVAMIGQPMIQAMLEHVGQTLLDWCWKAFEQRYADQLTNLQIARALSSQLLDPQLSLTAKCTALLNVLENSSFIGATIRPYLDVARHLKTILSGLQQPGSGVIKRGIDTLSNLVALLDLPAAQQMAGKDTLSPVRDLLIGALGWAQTLQRLSNASWDSPQAFADSLLQSGALPPWVTEIVEQGQRLYETLSRQLTAIKHKGEQLQRLRGLLDQFNQATGTQAKFAALLTLLLDEQMLGLIEQYAPAAMGDSLKVYSLLKHAIQDGGEQDTTGLRTTLLSMEHITSQPFIDRLGSEAGAVGQMMAEPLRNVRAALRGSASQEAAFNLLLGLSDPKKTWTDFVLESSREILLLPQVQDLGASFASRFAWQAQAIRALYAVLDDTFWAHYKTAAWAELPALISDTALRDTQNQQSQLALALAAASGIPGEHIQTVFTEVSKVCRSWGNDSWAEFLPKVTGSIENLLAVLVKHGQLLPTYVQTLLDIGLWAAKGISRLLMLHAVWKAKADDEVLGEATLALIRKAIEEYAGDNAAWAFDKAVIWLPMLPPLYKVLGNLEPIKEGQRVQWLANVLMRLYSLPEAQTNKDVIWVREQIEAKAEQWLGNIPAALLGNAIVEEIQSKPGFDLTPMFTRAVQLQGLASYMADCFDSLTNTLQGVDVMSGIQAALNPAGVQISGRQRPAYLRDLTTFYAVLPDSYPQQPISTTTQNIAPKLWGTGAGATFLGGILFTYFAYKNFRKGNQTPPQTEVEMDSLMGGANNVQNVENSESIATEEQRLNESPYKPTSVLLKQKSSHWKKTGALTAMASLMFGASAYSLWKTQSALADNTVREKINRLEALEVKAREDFYAGNTHTLSDDLTQFLETLSTFESFDDVTVPPTTNAAPEMASNMPRPPHKAYQQQSAQNALPDPAAYNDSLKTSARVRRSTPEGLNPALGIDNVLPLMKEAQLLIQTIIARTAEGKTQHDLAYLYGRFGEVKLQLNALRDFTSQLTPDSSGQLLTNREVYAYYLLAEMKSYYSEEDYQLWGRFAPYSNIVFNYQNTQGQSRTASAPLIDFLNGNIQTKLATLGANGSYTFSAEHEDTAAAQQLRSGTAHYIPGNWTKTQELQIGRFQSHAGVPVRMPSMTDEVTVRTHPKNPMEQSTGTVRVTKLTLDDYFTQKFANAEYADPYETEEVIWPQHYTPLMKALLNAPGFAHNYTAGQRAIAELNERLEQLRAQKIEAYDKKIKTYSGDDVLNNSELITQYSWQDLIFENNGTPIGFTESDVINRAIASVEARIVHYQQQRDLLSNAPDWQQDYQSEIEKLIKTLSALHQKQGDSERIEAESLNGEALFDKEVEDFAAELWTQKTYQNPLKDHPQLSQLTPQSLLSVALTQGSQINHISMPFKRILAGEHLRWGASVNSSTVEWPSGLMANDTLLNKLINECTRYRKSLERGLETENASKRINIPTIDTALQQGLDKIKAQQSPALKKQGPINLSDTVNVRFYPLPKYFISNVEVLTDVLMSDSLVNPDFRPDPALIVNQTYTLKQVMGKAPEAKYSGMWDYNTMQVDTEGKYPKEFIKALREIDWQRKLEADVDKLRNNQQLKDDWRLVFSPLISKKINATAGSRVNTIQLNSVGVPGVYKIVHPNRSIELHSIFNPTVWKFDTSRDLIRALDTLDNSTENSTENSTGNSTPTHSTSQTRPDTAQQNHKFYTWLNEHQEDYYVEKNTGRNYITSVNPRETENADRVADLAFDHLMSSLYSNIDTWLKSDSELYAHRAFEFFEKIAAPLIGVLTYPITGPMTFLIAAGLAAVPFGELAIADTKEEFRETAINAAINAAFELGTGVVAGGLSKIPVQKIIKVATSKKIKPPVPGKSGLPTPAAPLRLEPYRHSAVGKINNIEAGTEHYLTKLKENNTILNGIDQPDGKCANLLSIVGPRISQADIGMTDIKYRGLLIWNNAMEIIPSNHFVVLGTKNGERYVFDLSAAQFHNKGMPDLDGPLILKEADWVQKYSNATTRKLIKYKDFNAPDSATNSFRSMPGLFSPSDVIEDGVLLTMPQWYKTLTHWNPNSNSQPLSQLVYGSNAVSDAAQALNASTSSNARWDYAIDVLRDADVLTATQARKLTEGLIEASNNRGLGNSGRIDNLLSDIRTVNTAEGLLRIKKGELVVFMQANSGAPAAELQPVHIVTCLGNGRFAGAQNSIIDPALGDQKGIINAEQFGAIGSAGLTRAGSAPGAPTLEIKAGFPMGYRSPYAPSLTEAAATAARIVDTDISSAQYVSRTLELSGDLAYEQGQAFKNAAADLANPSIQGSRITLDKIMNNPQKLTSLQALKSVPKGYIMAATSSDSYASHLMLSLGNEKFATSGLSTLSPDLPHANTIVTAEQLYRSMQEGKLGGLDLQSGAVNLNNFRAEALRVGTAPSSPSKNPAQSPFSSNSIARTTIVKFLFNNREYQIAVTQLNNNTTLYSVVNDPGVAVSVSSHAEYTPRSPTMKAPTDMSLAFLSPHNRALQNTGGTGFFNVQSGMNPHSIVSDGGRTVVFSPYKASDSALKPLVPHTHNTFLYDATGSTKPGEIMDYSLSHFPQEKPQDIMANIALNRELLLLNTPNIKKTDYLTVDPSSKPVLFSSVITELRQLPVPPQTVTAVFCRSRRPSTTYSYNPMGQNSGASYVLKGHQNTYDITGSEPKLVSRVLVTLSRVDTSLSIDESNRNRAAQQAANERDTTIIAGPLIKDIWQKKDMWLNGLAFSQFEALDDSGSMQLADTASNFMTLTAKDPIAADRWSLEWSINTGPPQDRKGRKVHSTMEGVLDNLGAILTALTAGNCTYKISTGNQNRILATGSIIDKASLVWTGNLQYGVLNLGIPSENGIYDHKLRSLKGEKLIDYFGMYMSAKNFATGYNPTALDIVHFLLKYHAIKHPEGLKSPVSRRKIEAKFYELSISQPIAEVLAYMLTANESSITIAPGSSPFSGKEISIFLRTLTESVFNTLKFVVNDDGLHRLSMAGRFESDKNRLINTCNVRPELAAWLIAIRYMDADIDNILGRVKLGYKATTIIDNKAKHFDEIGMIIAATDANGGVTTLTRDNRAKVSLYNGDVLVFEKIYEIPPRFRGSMMSRYIANAINVDMNKIEFNNAALRPSSIVAGQFKTYDINGGKKVYGVVPSYEPAIYIYSDLNQINPGNDFRVQVVFL